MEELTSEQDQRLLSLIREIQGLRNKGLSDQKLREMYKNEMKLLKLNFEQYESHLEVSINFLKSHVRK